MALNLYYDGDCPFCSRYVRYLRLKQTLGRVELVNLRESPSALNKLRALGLNADLGMVAELDGHYYLGADAMHLLALLSTPQGLFNRLNRWLFSRAFLASLWYPLLRMGRNFLLLLMGRPPLGVGKETPLLTLFAAAWGLFAVFHGLVYFYDFNAERYLVSYLIPILGAWLLFTPTSKRLLLVLLGVMVLDAWLHMPIFSNHTQIKNFLLLAFLMGGGYSALKGRSWSAFFDDVAPVGRALLVVMYIFGVFHKINADFLNPDVSCAVVLWREMPWPLTLLDNTGFHYLAIYGTLIIESVILLCLLMPSLRYWGIVFGMAFHMMLALSNYALYTAFSMLTVTLHLLFLRSGDAQRIIDSSLWQRFMGLANSKKGLALLVAYGLVLVLYAQVRWFAWVSVFWFFIAIPLLYLVVKFTRPEDDKRSWSIIISRRWWLNLVSIAFFVNCFTPYLGLKTAQSINMFANLRLEGGVSNHLVLPRPPGPFGYLEDLISIEGHTSSPYLNYIEREGLHLTYYDLLNRLERKPYMSVSFWREGKLHKNQSAQTLKQDLEDHLHPRWVRKWFHFTPVDTKLPKPCALDR